MLKLLLSLRPLLHQGKVGIKLAIAKNVELVTSIQKNVLSFFIVILIQSVKFYQVKKILKRIR